MPLMSRKCGDGVFHSLGISMAVLGVVMFLVSIAWMCLHPVAYLIPGFGVCCSGLMVTTGLISSMAVVTKSSSLTIATLVISVIAIMADIGFAALCCVEVDREARLYMQGSDNSNTTASPERRDQGAVFFFVIFYIIMAIPACCCLLAIFIWSCTRLRDKLDLPEEPDTPSNVSTTETTATARPADDLLKSSTDDPPKSSTDVPSSPAVVSRNGSLMEEASEKM